jgi:hypothetical protein
MEAGRREAINCGEARGRFQPGSGGAGETMRLTSGACVAVTEGERVATGLRKLEEEVGSGNYAKAAQAGMGRARVHGPREEGAPGRVGGLRGHTGRLAVGPFWAESEENSFPNKNLILIIARLWKFVGGILT